MYTEDICILRETANGTGQHNSMSMKMVLFARRKKGRERAETAIYHMDCRVCLILWAKQSRYILFLTVCLLCIVCPYDGSKGSSGIWTAGQRVDGKTAFLGVCLSVLCNVEELGFSNLVAFLYLFNHFSVAFGVMNAQKS